MSRAHAAFLVIGLVAGACSGDAPSSSEPVPNVVTPVATPTPLPAPTATPLPTSTARRTPTVASIPTPTPSCAEQLPVRVALAQLVLPLATPSEFAEAAELAARREASGVVVLGSPTAEDLGALPRTDSGGVPFLLSSDEEGGRVQRLRGLLGPIPAASSLVGTPTADVTDLFRAYGTAMRELGFGMAFAPVVDVGAGPGIADRSFSDDPSVVIQYGQAVVDGYVAAGVVPVLKHFPGHGRGSADSHIAVSVTPEIEDLRAADLLPFEALLAPGIAVMVGHLVVPGLTEGLPASVSPAAIDGLLRTDMGFEGLVMTDALNMDAVADQWGIDEAVRLALVAGADMAIVDSPAQVGAVLDYLEAAIESGSLTRAQIDDSVERVFAAKAADPCDALAP